MKCFCTSTYISYISFALSGLDVLYQSAADESSIYETQRALLVRPMRVLATRRVITQIRSTIVIPVMIPPRTISRAAILCNNTCTKS